MNLRRNPIALQRSPVRLLPSLSFSILIRSNVKLQHYERAHK